MEPEQPRPDARWDSDDEMRLFLDRLKRTADALEAALIDAARLRQEVPDQRAA